jgi:serine/threonine protein kinase
VNSRVGTTFGPYKITALLGKGGMGEVYQAYDTDKGRTVALKILTDQFSRDETFRTRFLRESRAAAILQEPHVIPIHTWGEIDDCMYIDMRLVQGKTLYELLETGPLEPTRAVAIVGQIASALDAAHAERLIHRDVKPQNIIVTPEDFAYLVDFGIAETKGEDRLTMTGTLIGSHAYMAPERYLDRGVTPAVDVYALACVLYEALTGDTPFPTDSLEQLIVAHVSSPPPRPTAVNPNLPPSFDEVISRGMAKEADDRYGSAGALGRAAQRSLRADWRMAPDAATMLNPQATFPAVGRPQFEPAPRPQFEPAPRPQFEPAPRPQFEPAPRPQAPRFEPRPVPPTDPMVLPRQQPPAPQGGRSRGWVLPTVIVIAAALILGAIGVVIGLLANQDSGQTTTAAPTTTLLSTTQRTQTPQTSSAPPSPTATALPPVVKGPDNSSTHQTCDDGFSVPNETGFGSRSGRGTPETSCYFADSVLKAYWAKYGRPVRELRTVSAPGSVACQSTGVGRCDGANFLMDCAAYGSDDWVTCSGGNNARVYLY